MTSELFGEQVGEWLVKNRKDLTPQALARLVMEAMTRLIACDQKKSPGEVRQALAMSSLCLHAMGFQLGYSLLEDGQEMFRGILENPRSMLPRPVELAEQSEGGHLPNQPGNKPNGQQDLLSSGGK